MAGIITGAGDYQIKLMLIYPAQINDAICQSEKRDYDV